MRFSFEKNLEQYRDLTREAAMEEMTQQESEELERDLGSAVSRAARKRESSRDTQWAIVDLQAEKQAVMRKLHERLALLDNPEQEDPEDLDARAVRKSGSGYVAVGRNGEELPITKGEVMTDMQWGLRYRLDDSVERSVRKRYLVERAKVRLNELLDKQITADEVGSARTHENLRHAFEARDLSTGQESGFLAEKMVKGFLTKLTYDHDVDFRVHETDAFDDVVRKMDFALILRKHERGVDVEESDSVDHVSSEVRGVQFTINDSPEAQERKRAQLQRVNENLRDDEGIRDVVLVTMPTPSIQHIYRQWEENPQPGGPDSLWSDETKHAVFSEVMKDMMTPNEIQDQWARITSNEAEDSQESAARA